MKLIFRCWVRNEEDVWEELESVAHLKPRPKPRWIPQRLWEWLLRRVLFLEAEIDTGTGYIDPMGVTVQEVK